MARGLNVCVLVETTVNLTGVHSDFITLHSITVCNLSWKDPADERSQRKKRSAQQPSSTPVPASKVRLLEKEPESPTGTGHESLGTLSSGLYDFDDAASSSRQSLSRPTISTTGVMTEDEVGKVEVYLNLNFHWVKTSICLYSRGNRNISGPSQHHSTVSKVSDLWLLCGSVAWLVVASRPSCHVTGVDFESHMIIHLVPFASTKCTWSVYNVFASTLVIAILTATYHPHNCFLLSTLQNENNFQSQSTTSINPGLLVTQKSWNWIDAYSCTPGFMDCRFAV